MTAPDHTALISRLEACEGPDRELDRLLTFELIQPKYAVVDGRDYGRVPLEEVDGVLSPPLTSSLDAALALVEAKLPGWNVNVFSDCGAWFARVEDHQGFGWRYVSGFDGAGVGPESKCIALLHAMLRALAGHPGRDVYGKPYPVEAIEPLPLQSSEPAG